MGKIQVVAVIVRLFAIALLVYTIRQTPDFVLFYKIDFDSSIDIAAFYETRAFALLMIMILGLALSLFLWFFPLTIARRLVPNANGEEVRKWDNDTQLSVAFIILGVYFSYFAIVDLLYWAMMVVLSIRHHDLLGPLEVEDWVNICLTFVELFLAVLLIFRSRGITRLILKFRGRLT
ncbi:MAG: hypothetical protein ABFS08_11715 [Pseudomonadota bacterium]